MCLMGEDKKKIINFANIESKTTEDNIILSTPESFTKAEFYTTALYTDKDFNNFIKNVERHVRNDDGYKQYISYLRYDGGLDKCAFLNNASSEEVTIELHHYPFTLYDIVLVVVDHALAKNIPITTFGVAEEVLELHYNNWVGLVPVSTTVHEAAHAGQIFISLKQVFGDYYKFIEKYRETFPPNMIKNFNKLVVMSNTNSSYSDIDILQKK